MTMQNYNSLLRMAFLFVSQYFVFVNATGSALYFKGRYQLFLSMSIM